MAGIVFLKYRAFRIDFQRLYMKLIIWIVDIAKVLLNDFGNRLMLPNMPFFKIVFFFSLEYRNY